MKAPLNTGMQSRNVTLKGLQIHYLEAGKRGDELTLLLHGWPTSAYLWRNIMPSLADHHWVIALDLPGFGQSAKSPDLPYNLAFYQEILDALIEKLGVSKVNLVVHDLGGPVGLYWISQRPQLLNRLVMLNTLVYPQVHWFMKLFVLSTYLPFYKTWLTSPAGIKASMFLGSKTRLSKDTLAAYQAPFQTENDRLALLRTLQKFDLKGLNTIGRWLPKIEVPVLMVYGKKDIILLDIERTMQRIKKDIPHAEIHCVESSGHFIQEDAPEKVSQFIRAFLKNEKLAKANAA